MSFFDRSRGKKPARPTTQVPPGHSVTIVHPAPQAMFGQMQSGIWIADFGPSSEHERVFAAAEQVLQKDPTSSIIWVIQAGALIGWTTEAASVAAWLRRFHQVRRIRGAGVVTGDTAVIPESSPPARSLMILLQSLGVGVHLPGPDGAVFVEVHRPDGIVAGMPGPAFKSHSDLFLHQLNLERDQAEQSLAPSTILNMISTRELAFIEKVIREAGTTR